MLLKEGVTTTISYGLAVARTVRFPADIMNEAFELSREFMSGISAQIPVRIITIDFVCVCFRC